MGRLSDGASCSNTATHQITRLSINETIDFLEAQAPRHCVPVPGIAVCSDHQEIGVPIDLPERGAAIFRSLEDEGKLHTALETACRLLGPRCSYQTRQFIAEHKKQIQSLGGKLP